jgi:hypothetical protein
MVTFIKKLMLSPTHSKKTGIKDAEIRFSFLLIYNQIFIDVVKVIIFILGRFRSKRRFDDLQGGDARVGAKVRSFGKGLYRHLKRGCGILK